MRPPRSQIWFGLAVVSALVTSVLGRITTPWLFGLEFEPLMLHLAVSTALASLLGLWSALARPDWRVRVLGLVAGSGALEALFYFSGGDEGFPGLLSTLAGFVSAAFGLLRSWKPGFRLARSPAATPQLPHARVSLATVMLATAALALPLAASRAVHEGHFGGIRNYVMIAYTAGLFLIDAIGATLAMLREPRPLAGTLAVLSIAPSLGALCAFDLGGPPSNYVLYGYLVSCFSIHAALMLAILAVFRRSGWRLVDRRREEAGRIRSFANASVYGG